MQISQQVQDSISFINTQNIQAEEPFAIQNWKKMCTLHLLNYTKEPSQDS